MKRLNSIIDPPQGKFARPKPCYQWTTADVQKWFKRHCSEYFQLYSHLFSTVGLPYESQPLSTSTLHNAVEAHFSKPPFNGKLNGVEFAKLLLPYRI